MEKHGVYSECEWCGKITYKTQTDYNKHKHHFCSNTCSGAYQSAQRNETRYCEICGEPFTCLKRLKQRFCSKKCQNKWQSTQVGDLNPRTHKIMYPCDNCGKIIPLIQGNVDRFKQHFCSNECRQKWYADVWSQGEDWKKESSKRATEMLVNGVIDTNTKPQRITNRLLNELGIKYVNEYLVSDKYSVDNYLSDYNLIIEVMGDYWHSNPTIYSKENLYGMQKRTAYRDKKKRIDILESEGIHILYLYESDLYKNESLCKKLIEMYIANNGKMSNYYSYNYSYIDGSVVLNENPIYPIYDESQSNVA